MARYSPWLENLLKYPYQDNPKSLKTRYKNFLWWFIKVHWIPITFTLIGALAVSLECFLQKHWYVWIFQNPFSEDVMIDSFLRLFVGMCVWLSIIPMAFLSFAIINFVPGCAEKMLASPTDTQTVGNWIRRSYEIIPCAFFVAMCFAVNGTNPRIAYGISGIICIICIGWYPIYEKFFHDDNIQQE